MNIQKQPKPELKVSKRLIICILILLFGLIGKFGLAKLKKPPAEAVKEEPFLKVEVLKAVKADVNIIIKGFGEVRALDIVSIAPEVPGKIVEVHPRLEVGGIIPQSEILFKIDNRDYLIDYNYGLKRLKILKRNCELAKTEFKRIQSLFQIDNVESQSRVDMTEQAFNAATDMVNQLEQGLSMAKLRLERCEVKSPFNGRVIKAGLKKGQYVSPGIGVLTLSDDSILEILVSIDSRDARKWLLKENHHGGKTTWFDDVVPVSCNIFWTENSEGHSWEGTLHRIVEFNSQTRTLTLAVRVNAQEAVSDTQDKFPLVAGMFCSVEITGKTIPNVIKLPRWSVSYENTVYVAQNKRLKTVMVDVLRVEGEETLISGGLNDGELVVITRLADPLENTLLDFTKPEKQQPESEDNQL